MKQIIQYRVYNTAVDRCLGGWNNGFHPESTSYYEENLYVTPTGAYYLYQVGGPDSPCRMAWGGRPDYFGEASLGCQIRPLTNEQAWGWGKAHLPSPEAGLA